MPLEILERAMSGKVVLAGGNELRPGCEAMDRRVLAEAGGADALVVFLPTAVARYDPVGSGRGAVAYFSRLGARCKVAMILNRADADDPAMVSLIESASLIYLGGGDPDVLLEALAGSRAWEAALRAHAGGAVLGGSSAGAMVVCEYTLLPGRGTHAPVPWTTGLGLVAGALVLPHYRRDGKERATALAAQLRAEGSPGSTVLGIPEQSAALGDGDRWEVAGPGPVTVFSNGGERSIGAGQHFQLSAAGA